MRRKGFLLGLVLLLGILLMVMGMGYAGGLVRQYQGTFQAVVAAQARALARAGLEDARVKLTKDYQFPPPGAGDQQVFTYSEDVTDASGTMIGVYMVSVDTTYKQQPYQLIRITSTGQAVAPGTRTNILAQDTIVATLNVNNTNATPPPFRYLRWEHKGSY